VSPEHAESEADRSASGAADEDGEADASDERTVQTDDAVTNGENPGTVEEGVESDATDGADSGGDGAGADQPSILSTPAAQKVIKLLQNREFPVEREELEVVASNAYAIPQQDCEDVIEALVSEGYVGERSGKLVRPEE
jgi:hypothetical protein